MTNESTRVQAEGQNLSAPDLIFKLLTRQDAIQAGLVPVETELQYSTRTDLVLNVPPGLDLTGTAFDFFRAKNVVEFKSQGDQFDLTEYVRNSLRTDLIFLQEKAKSFDNILNVIITSRSPDGFLLAATRRGINFQPAAGRPWLLRGQVGFQDVAIVVCRDLPIELTYYNWLVFAPSDTRKWQAFVETLLQQRNRELLRIIKKMRPREFIMLTKSLDDLIKEAKAEGLLDPDFVLEFEVDEETRQLELETTSFLLKTIAQEKSGRLAEVLAGLKPEDRLTGLTPEDRLTGLTPEDRQKLLELLNTRMPQENSDK